MPRIKAFDEEQVIEQAMELFRRQGYEATSIRDLIAHLGVSSSSLYSTFGDKDALFMLALARHSRLEWARIRRQLVDSVDPRTTIEGLFIQTIDQLLSEELPYGSLTLRAAVELGLNKPRVAAFLSAYLDELVTLFTGFLDEAVQQGRLTLTDPAPDVARYLLLALFNLSALAQMHLDRDALERYARVVLRALDGAASRPLVAVADMPVGG
ncbi:MAG: TetR/AcrR family transcriptional regulator [Caldilineaceae bacterium]|nr:TetR/AcrR family transcriptional regulator [Caldilineaceae bacterium]